MKIIHAGVRVPVAVLVLFCVNLDAKGAEPAAEAKLIQILESASSLQDKDTACAELKRTGTVASIPALSALLTHPDLSHSARYALESMPFAEAGGALQDALGQTTGTIQIGILQSLGVRNEGEVERIEALISNADPAVAGAAVSALGTIASPEAVRALSGAVAIVDTGLRGAIHHALLRSAYQQLRNGRGDEAAAIFRSLDVESATDTVRGAALLGTIASVPPTRALEVVIAALQDSDKRKRFPALHAARQLNASDATRSFCYLVVQSTDPDLQAAMVAVLHQRGDRAAVPTLSKLASGPDLRVRVAAITALGDLGGADVVPTLAKAVTAPDEDESKAALQALLILRHSDVNTALIDQLTTAAPAVKRALVRTLIGRADTSAVPGLITLAREGNDFARQALGRLAQAEHVPEMVRLVTAARDEPIRHEAGDALRKLCIRILDDGQTINPESLLSAYSNSKPEIRMALLPTVATLSDPRLRALLRKELNSEDRQLKPAAIQALIGARDVALLPDQLTLARESTDPGMRVRTVRGYLRLVTDTSSATLSPSRRVAALDAIASLAEHREEKWIILGNLADTPSSKSLELALEMLDHDATRAEAIQAVTKIAAAIQTTDREAAHAAIEKVLAVSTDPGQTEAACTVLDQMTTAAGTVRGE